MRRALLATAAAEMVVMLFIELCLLQIGKGGAMCLTRSLRMSSVVPSNPTLHFFAPQKAHPFSNHIQVINLNHYGVDYTFDEILV